MFDFFGFSAKYCIPSNIAGKVLNRARIYYGNDWVCEYNYNRKKNEISFGFLNDEIEEALKGIVHETSKKYGTPNDFPTFIVGMIGYIEMQHHLKNLLKEGYKGVLAVIGKDCCINRLIPLKEYSQPLYDSIQKAFPDFDCIPVFDKDDFDVAVLLGKD